jgi:hypothetical protein
MDRLLSALSVGCTDQQFGAWQPVMIADEARIVFGPESGPASKEYSTLEPLRVKERTRPRGNALCAEQSGEGALTD